MRLRVGQTVQGFFRDVVSVTSSLFDLGTSYRVVDELSDLVIGELVGDLSAAARRRDEAGVAEHFEVLRQQWLTDLSCVGAQRGLEFVDAAGADAQLRDHREADRGRQGLEELDRGIERVERFGPGHTQDISSPLYKQLAMNSLFVLVPITVYLVCNHSR